MQNKISMNNQQAKTVQEAFDQFIRTKQVMNVADATIEYYKYSFKWFIEYVGADASCENITEQTIMDYLFHVRETKPHLAQKTVSTYMRALRSVLYYFMKVGYTEKFSIQLPRTEETIKDEKSRGHIGFFW